MGFDKSRYKFELQGAIPILLAILLFHDILIPWLYLLRITHIVPSIGHIEKLFFLMYLLVSVFYLVKNINTIKIPIVVFIFSFITAYGIVVSFFFPLELRYAIPSFATMIFAMVAMTLGSNICVDKVGEGCINVIRRFTPYIIMSFLLGFGIYYYLQIFTDYKFYPSFVAYMLLLPLLYSIVCRKHGLTAFLLILIVLSGKRGPAFAVLIVICAYYLFYNIQSFWKGTVKVLMILIPFIIIVDSGLIYTFKKYEFMSKYTREALSIPEEYSLRSLSIPGEYSLGSLWGGARDLEEDRADFEVSSGRIQELKDAGKVLSNNGGLVTGMGYSFFYSLLDDEGNIVENRGYVHISPFTLYFRFGIVSFLLVAIIYIVPLLKFRNVYSENKFRSLMYMLFFVAMLNSLFAYTIAYEFFFWFCFGLIYNRKMSQNKHCVIAT